MLKIALLGAPQSGKSRLASELAQAAKASAWPVVIVNQADIAAWPAAASSHDLVLLTGLEPATHPHQDASQTDLQRTQQAVDAAIRAALAGAGIAYRVLYGRSSERLAQACAAIESLLPAPADRPAQAVASRAAEKPAPWVWLCDKCSDPQCEHRLLTALLAGRPARN